MADTHKKTLTIAGRTDGFGAQYLAFMSGIAFCEYKGWEYVHTPIKTLLFGEIPAEMNEFIGIPASTKTHADTSCRLAEAVHYAKRPDTYYTDAVRAQIREFYYRTPKPAACQYDIALHIRRGDVQRFSQYRFRYVSNKRYRQILTHLKAKFPNYSIGIYSQGKIDDFAELTRGGGGNVHFCLNEDLKKTFHAMVTAKVLVTARSDLSYAAALLSKGEIYYTPYWHRPLKSWKRFEGNDIFGRLLFNFRLQLHELELWWFRFRFNQGYKRKRLFLKIHRSLKRHLSARFK